MYICSVIINNNNLKRSKMEATMKLAIETYAELTNRTFNEVVAKMQTNKVIQENIMKLMFCVA